MAKPMTLAMVQAMLIKLRMTLYNNARNTDGSEANAIVELLLTHGLLDKAGGGLPRDHRVIQEIEAICRSSEGIAAATVAATRGEPPLAAVDPLLVVGVREYGHFDTTTWAGGFIVEEMKRLGWRPKGQRKLPPGRVAKTAAFFLPPEIV